MAILKIENLSPESLKPDSKNPRSHPDKQIRQLRKSIKNLGFWFPILIDENNQIICGHARQS